jgi:hypothetical protein
MKIALKLILVSGYVNEKQFAGTLAAFSHWTHQATNGYLTGVDIQV